MRAKRPGWTIAIAGIGLLLTAGCASGEESDSAGFQQRLEAARTLRHEGKLEDAAALLQLLVQQTPQPKTAAKAMRELAAVFGARHQPQRARAALEQSLAADPGDATTHYELGMVLRDLGDHRGAASELQAAIEGGFRNSASRFYLVQALFDSRQTLAGVAEARALRASAGVSGDLLLRTGKLLFDHLFYEDAAAVLRLALQAQPGNEEIRAYLALVSYLLNHFDEALTLLSGAAGELTPEMRTVQAAAHAQKGDTVKAEALLREVIRAAPASPHAYLNLALLLLHQDRVPAAGHTLRQLQSLRSRQDVKVFYSPGWRTCSRFEPAADSSQKKPLTPTAWTTFLFDLASALQRGFRPAASLLLAGLAEEEEGPTARLLAVAGKACASLDPLSQSATRLLEAAAAQEPGEAETYLALGEALLRQQRSAEAAAALRKAHSLAPSLASASRLAEALLAENRDPAAAGQAKELLYGAISRFPNAAEPRFQLAKLHADTGETALAEQTLRKVLELEPDFYEAAYRLGRLLIQTGRAAEGQPMLARFEQQRKLASANSALAAGFSSQEKAR